MNCYLLLVKMYQLSQLLFFSAMFLFLDAPGMLLLKYRVVLEVLLEAPHRYPVYWAARDKCRGVQQ